MRKEGKIRLWEKHQKAVPSVDAPGGEKKTVWSGM